MEVINKRHEDLAPSRRTESVSYINFNTPKQILFSVRAVREFGLAPGLFVHFVNDEDYWLFYVNDDKDGFEIFKREGKTNVFLYNAHLVSLFFKRTGYGLGCKFLLTKTESKKDGCTLIKMSKTPIKGNIVKKRI